jgi:hypothetical protein
MTDGPSDAELTHLLDEARGDAAARERTRRRWLHQQALEGARLDGLLHAAAEQHQVVTLRLQSGRAHTGTIEQLGVDFCVMATTAGRALVRLEAIAVVVPDPSLSAVPAADSRAASAHQNFAEALADHAEDRPRVILGLFGGTESVRGALVAVGADVATVEINERGSLAYVSLSSVADASFLVSG